MTSRPSTATTDDLEPDLLRSSGRRGRDTWVAGALLCLLSIFLVGVHTHVYQTIGPIDELQHIDYADNIAHGRIPVFPAPIGQNALREESCRGIDAGGGKTFPLPPCGSATYDNTKYQEAGLSTQAFHPPLYYAVVGPIARVVAHLIGQSSVVTIERLLGAVWFAAGLCLTLGAAVTVGVRPWAAALALALVAVMPQMVYAHSSVNNDATAFFIGALSLWAITRDSGSRRFAGLLVVIGVVAGLTKVTNGFGIALAGLIAVMIPSINQRGDSSHTLWQRLRPGVCMIAGYLVATLAWQAYFTKTRLMSPKDLSIFNRFRPDSLSIASVLRNLNTYADPFSLGQSRTPQSSGAYIAMAYAKPLGLTLAFLGALIFLAAVYSTWIRGRGGTTATVMGRCTAVALLLAGPAQYLAVYLASSAGYTQTRYSWSMVPAYAIVTALVVRKQGRWIMAGILALSLVTFTFYSISAG